MGPINHKRVISVAIEMLQNIERHGEAREVVFEVNGNTIVAGNAIKNENVPALNERLEQLNGLNKQELKNLYLEILTNSQFSDKGGAGLGLVTIARKSRDMSWTFTPQGDDLSFFCLKVSVSSYHATDEYLPESSQDPMDLAARSIPLCGSTARS